MMIPLKRSHIYIKTSLTLSFFLVFIKPSLSRNEMLFNRIFQGTVIGDLEGILLGEGDTKRRQRNKRGSQRQRATRQQRPRTQSGDFEVSLLILASIIIKADGVQDQRELDYVRQQFVNMYGKDRANKAFALFKQIGRQKNISMRQVCLQIRQMMDHPSRLQLLHFLFGVAKADGVTTEDEVRQIYTMAGYLGISNRDFESIKAMFYNSQDNAYKILEIEKTATVDEIKTAYRKMAKKIVFLVNARNMLHV